MDRRAVRPRRSSRGRSFVAGAVLVAVAALATHAAAQSPSGEYGAVPLGGSVEGVLAGIVERDGFVYHTYTVAVPAAGPVTVRVDGFGSDIDLALKFGAPIVDYRDVDHLDTSADPNPAFTFQAPAAGILYVDVLNLLPQPARYRLSVAGTGTAAPATPSLPLPPTVPVAPPSPAAPPPAGANPLAPANPLVPAADPWLGAFEGDGLRVEIAADAGGYRGELVSGGQRFPFRASAAGPDRIEGSFDGGGGGTFAFSASLAGDVLTLSTGGATYVARRVGASAAPANPLAGPPAHGGSAAGAAAAGTAASVNVLATGTHGRLTQDDAEAYVDALVFVVGQIGASASLGAAERQEAVRELARNYPALPPAHQAALAQARDTWDRAQAGWATASQSDREQFVLGVLVIAFGEDAIRQALAGAGGGGSGGGGGGGCQTIDDCIGRYAPGGGIDINRTASCGMNWSCDSYEPSTGTFHYRDGR